MHVKRKNALVVLSAAEQKTLALSQQAVLQLLVLTQEQERKHLVKSVHGVSLENLQEPGCTVPPKEGKSIFSSFSAAYLSELVFFCIPLISMFHLSCFLFPMQTVISKLLSEIAV